MNALPPDDPLIALWQTAPASDTHNLAKEVKRLAKLHRRSNQSIVAILWCVAILLIFEEATGRLASHGIVSVIWILGLVAGLVWRRRVHCIRSEALASDTVSLLRFRLAQAKGDLFLARCLYAGVPIGGLIGYLAMKLAGRATLPLAASRAPNLHLLQTGAGLAVLTGMVATGAVLYRSRVPEVKALAERLKSIEDNV